MQFKPRKGKKYCKYNKITQQKKFHLLTLVLKEKLLIKEAAKIVAINYSTAKTIIFFHRNQGKSYQFDFRTQEQLETYPQRMVAGFADVGDVGGGGVGVDIVSTVGAKQASVDLFSLQTRFMDKHLNQTNSPSPKPQLSEQACREFPKDGICQCERRITRAQSAKQAGQDTFCSPALQEKGYPDAYSLGQPHSE